ncbi:MAG: transposase [Anaerolineae bacterium]|jgi:putative transposase|nr:transposase [Anaerolineae bacterium]MBT7189506.1 transposase [Anaerolineae bacterium]MBT7989732.1 transposase [Anaerolineae bacterium]
MPYEYRKLSPEERKEVVEGRKQQGYPAHSPPHPLREEGTYLITAANYEHKHILENPTRRTAFEMLLIKSFQEVSAEIIAWVILTNHYHLLLNIESFEIISDILQYIHGSTSHQWNKEDGQTGKRKVWYRFSDRMIRNEKHLQRTLNYVHYNPVKHGLVEDVYAWKWSSLFLYEDEKGKTWLQENWKKYKPSSHFGKDWDDL